MQYTDKDKKDFIQKEARELFCKAVNSILMTKTDEDIEKIIEKAKKIVDKAFEFYPPGKYEFISCEEELDIPVSERN